MPHPVSVDAAHRYSPELWARTHVDPQAYVSNAVHAALDAALGPRVKTLTAHEREAAYFACCIGGLVLVLLGLRPFLRAAWPAFARVSPAHKQMYALSNVVKSVVLGLQAGSASWWVYSGREYGCNLNPLGFSYGCEWAVDAGHQAYVKQICMLYVATDVAALLLVSKLPLTTKVHHYASAVWILWVMTIDFDASPVAQKLMFYGFWSTLAFPVNAFLGLRVVYPDAAWMAAVAATCFAVYAACCGINWGLHAVWALDGLRSRTLRWQDVAYLASLSVMVRDDLVLMRWLRRYRPGRDEKKKAR